MDITTLGGMIGGIAVILIGIMGSGELGNYYDTSSVMIVIGGTIGATLMAYPLSQFKNALKAAAFAFKKMNMNLNEEIQLIIKIANIARKEGLLALEDQVAELDDPFMKKGVMLMVDGSDPELIRGIMETELDFMVERHGQSQAVLTQMAAFAPSFGMAGTLVGLINMLQSLDDMASLGPNMSVALVTTFYGVLLANLVFTPLSNKLKAISSQEVLRKELLLEGLLSIQDGENPRIIQDKLEAFIARSEIQNINTKGETADAGEPSGQPAAGGSE